MDKQNAPDRIRFLPTSSRSVRLENRSALRRRWRWVHSGLLTDPRVIGRWFPGQRPLLDLLAVLGEDDIERLADCGTPLFGLQLRGTEFSLEACGSHAIVDPLEQDSVHESFLALSARLDAIRTSLQQACVLFGMSYSEATWLSRFCPQELHQLARDPSMVLQTSASHEYFILAAHPSSPLNEAQRTVLGAVSRRGPAPLAS